MYEEDNVKYREYLLNKYAFADLGIPIEDGEGFLDAYNKVVWRMFSGHVGNGVDMQHCIELYVDEMEKKVDAKYTEIINGLDLTGNVVTAANIYKLVDIMGDSRFNCKHVLEEFNNRNKDLRFFRIYVIDYLINHVVWAATWRYHLL